MFLSTLFSKFKDFNSKGIDRLADSDKPNNLEIENREKRYSDLLKIYVNSTKKNLKVKHWLKIIFFILTMSSFICIIYFFRSTLKYVFTIFDKVGNINNITIEAVLSIMAILIPAMSSLIVAFIKIPEIIAIYLFDTEEENNMNEIIKSIQDYDIKMFSEKQRKEALLARFKNFNLYLPDDNIEKSPFKDDDIKEVSI